MTLRSNRYMERGRSGVGLGPGPLWWVAHAIGGFGIGGLFLVWGLVIISRGELTIPLAIAGRLVLRDGAAALFGWALVAVCVGIIAHVFLSCFEPIKHVAQMGAKAAAGVALLLIIGALVHHAVV